MGAKIDRMEPAHGGWLTLRVPSAALASGLILWLGLSQLLLWRFLDAMPLWAYPLGLLLIGMTCFGVVRHGRLQENRVDGPTIAILLACFGVALILMLLGGQGRFFYANIDWQVRFAVLRDMTVNPWPFVYTASGAPDLLRAPIGMYLVPALAGKAWGGTAGDIALLLQNSAFLGTLLALGSILFDSRRARLIALAVVICFSGLDALGRLMLRGGLSDHLENWIGLQYSSTITLAFWVPNHALSGWTGAVAFLLWRAHKMPLGTFLALLPLTALWSPLGLMGAMPFAALAAARALAARAIRLPDIALPMLSTLLCVPGLLYMAAAPEAVGLRFLPLVPAQWFLFELLEVLVYVVPLILLRRANRFGVDTLALLTVWLLAIPFVQIGWSIDFMMRGSIVALTVLAVMTADRMIRPGPARLWLAAMLLIGSVTGLAEIRRALVWPPAPQVRCSFSKAWDQSFGAFPKGSWLAPLDEVPLLVRPTDPALASAPEPARCWNGRWHHPDDGPTSG